MNGIFKLILICAAGLVGAFSCCLSTYYGEIEKNPVDSLLYGLLGVVCIIATVCGSIY